MTAVTEDLRVTSVWEYKEKTRAVFSGVPLTKNSTRTRSSRNIVVVRTIPELLPMKPVVGQHWRITGEMEERQRVHGDYKITERHFINPDRCKVTLPHNGEDFIRFIARETDFTGIGEVKARELWSQFGEEIFTILENKDARQLKLVLTQQAIDSLLEGYEKYGNLKYATWFADHHIPPYIQERLFKFHKAVSIDPDNFINPKEAIKHNPYSLISFGMTFEKVDALAQDYFDRKADDPQRLTAAVESSLQNHAQRGGHTLAYHRDIAANVRKLVSKELVGQAMKHGSSSLAFKLDEKTGAYHHTALYIMEKVVAKRLTALLSKNSERTDVSEHGEAAKRAIAELSYSLTSKQEEAVLSAATNQVSCITGGAGTGKTTVLRTVLRAYHELGYVIKPIALSGRAAMRLHESIGFKTSTIAAFLKEDPLLNEDHLDQEIKSIVVIDEASMVDIGTMYKIVLHTDPSVRLLFVGDPNQLPPIGPGLVLADIIKFDRIKNIELDIVKRQDASTGIPEYSRMIQQGNIPSKLSVGDIHFHDVSSENIADVCTDLYRTNPEESQVIAATKKLTGEINEQCQSLLNSSGERLEFVEYQDHYYSDLRRDDPVLFTQNNYDVGVQNGSLGRLISVEQTPKHYGIVKLDDSGDEIAISKPLLDSLMLGYAVTLHKAQGSQFKRVIVALSDSRMIDRAWLYTAVTRAETELHLVGSEDKMHQAVHSLSARYIRQTYLADLLKNNDENTLL